MPVMHRGYRRPNKLIKVKNNSIKACLHEESMKLLILPIISPVEKSVMFLLLAGLACAGANGLQDNPETQNQNHKDGSVHFSLRSASNYAMLHAQLNKETLWESSERTAALPILL